MRKIVCVSVPFVLSQFHLSSIESTINNVRSSSCCDRLLTLGVANAIRPKSDDHKILGGIYEELIINDSNILARAWNKGIARAIELGATHILIHNLDIQFHPEAIERLADAVDAHPEFILFSPNFWRTKDTLTDAQLGEGVVPGGHMCCFMIRPDFMDQLGKFDELFSPAYQEDTDMFYRMSLNNLQGAFVNDAYMYHAEGGTFRGCLTIEGATAKDKIVMANSILERIKRCDELYEAKWGGPRGKEVFKTPFDRPISNCCTKQSELVASLCMRPSSKSP